MADPPTSARRFSSATVALVAAGLIALVAIGIALLRSGETAAAPSAAGNSAAAAQPPSLDASIAQLREGLRRDPDNDSAWYLLGLAYRDSERFAEAEQAFRRAMELAPGNADYAAYVGEALLLNSDGNPPPEAERLFRHALELQPGNPQARYYLATLQDMAGHHREAVDALIALVREAPADAPWEPQVRGAVTTIAREHNIDIAGRLPPPRQPQATASTATAAIPGPTREQMAAASSIPPSQQDEMVRAMVDRLAGRLRQNPRDEQGWVRLMRSRMVLNDPSAARGALNSALAAFHEDAATQQRLRAAARELGVPGAG